MYIIFLFRLDLNYIINQMKLFTQELILSYADQLIQSTIKMIHRQGDIFDVSF